MHEGLENCKIRDFLCSQLESAQHRLNNLKPKTVPYSGKNACNSIIENDRLHIEYLKERIMLYEQIQAVLTLIEANGWKEFDVSDEIEKDVPTGWLSFIGTKEEHKNLLKAIKLEEKR